MVSGAHPGDVAGDLEACENALEGCRDALEHRRGDHWSTLKVQGEETKPPPPRAHNMSEKL